MSSSSRIQLLIGATLSVMTTGCGSPSDEWGAGGPCPPDVFALDVNDWNLTSERFTAMTNLLAEYGESWAALDAQSQCAMACLYANGSLDTYWAAGDTEGDASITTELCSLTLIVDGATVTNGSVSCTAELERTFACVAGRRPLAWTSEDGTSDPGSQLDRLASFEHVSITAFLELAAQLEALGAPAALIERCQAAAADERRHVALLVGLGATAPTQRVTPTRSSSRLAIARHNAVEGCVNETWAALLAHWQAEHAAEPETRLAFATIAEDETRHAQLAWDLHDWLISQLDPSERATIEAERQRALDRLAATATSTALATPAEVRHALGLPDPRRARALAREFANRLSAGHSTLASADQLALPTPGSVRPASSSSAS